MIVKEKEAMKNKVNPELVFNVLTQFSHHKKDRVFFNEFSQFLSSDKDDYYFLSDDYYEHHLTRDSDGSLLLVAVSEDEKILARTVEANKHLRSF